MKKRLLSQMTAERNLLSYFLNVKTQTEQAAYNR